MRVIWDEKITNIVIGVWRLDGGGGGLMSDEINVKIDKPNGNEAK